MNRFLVLGFMIYIFYSCRTKNDDDSKVSIEYIKQAQIFITQVKKSQLDDKQFILESNVRTIDNNDCLKEVLLDTLTFSRQERDYISGEAKKPTIQSWTNEIFPNIKIVSSDTIRKIFKDYSKEHSKGWDYFYSHIGKSADGFSSPIFYKNYTYCLFYSDHYCGFLCAEGSLTLYKKEGNKWIEVKSFCNWAS